MIMAVRPAPSSVPATPKRDVTKAAAAAANPAAITWLPLTTADCCDASLTVLTLPTNPARFKEDPVPVGGVLCRRFHTRGVVAAGSATPLEFWRDAEATERLRMTEANGGKFSELFEVIRDYSKREQHYQDKALQVIAGSYVFMFENQEMPDARGVVDDILSQYDYVCTTVQRGNLDPLSVDAVVRVALYSEEYTEWGINRLGRILESLLRRSRADETYSDYVEDAGVVIRGLESIVAGSVLEEIVEATDAPEP